MIWQHDSQEDFEYNESKLSQKEKTKLDYRVSEGRFKNTIDFVNAPSQFLNFAIENWEKLCIEKN